MRKNILITIVSIVAVLCILFCGSISKSNSYYEFRNSTESIVSIELQYNYNELGLGTEQDNIHSIRMLTQDEIPVFMEEACKIPVKECYPPWWGWGCYIAKVTYSNGDVEVLGSHNIEYIPSRNTAFGTGVYTFAGDRFEEVFSKYIDSDEFPFTGY